MSYYFDTSALAKLILIKTESPEFQEFFASTTGPRMRFTSRLTETELMRMVHRSTADIADATTRILRSIPLAAVDTFTLKRAGALLPGTPLRTLDAIHLATATRLTQLKAVVTYDERMIKSAQSLGIKTISPGVN